MNGRQKCSLAPIRRPCSVSAHVPWPSNPLQTRFTLQPALKPAAAGTEPTAAGANGAGAVQDPTAAGGKGSGEANAKPEEQSKSQGRKQMRKVCACVCGGGVIMTEQFGGARVNAGFVAAARNSCCIGGLQVGRAAGPADQRPARTRHVPHAA